MISTAAPTQGSDRGSVLILCALMPEASPLIEALDLEPGPKFGAMQIFGQHSATPLAVTGIGAHASAAAVGLLRAQRCPSTRPSVLNVGVSGHASFQEGTAWLAHKVLGEQGSDHPLYPGFYRRPHLPTDTLTTRERVERCFESPGGYDMEGFGCLRAALCFASAEQCALLKIVSDGPAMHQGPAPFRLNAKRARALVAAAWPAIQAQIELLLQVSHDLSTRYQAPRHFEELLQTGHFTQAQKHRLKSMLTQWGARFPDQTPDLERFERGAQCGLDGLHTQLQAYEPLRPPADGSLRPPADNAPPK